MTISDALVIVSLLVLAWQTYLLRCQIHSETARAGYEYWIKVTEFQVDYPAFHRMVISSDTLEIVRDLSEEEMKLRAMAWLLLDTFHAMWQDTEPALPAKLSSRIEEWREKRTLTRRGEIKQDITRIMSNPGMRRAWVEWGLRLEFEGLPFQRFVDSVVGQSKQAPT